METDERSTAGARAAYRVLTATDIPDDERAEFANAVLQGLSERPKQLPSRYIYDDVGSEYFQQIMALEEYYPTQCEAEILQTHGARILERFQDESFNLIDLGAGDGTKTLILLRQLDAAGANVSFVPIDISEGAIAGLTRVVGATLPGMDIAGLVADYTAALRWLRAQGTGRRNLVLFLGSNIGNFNRPQASAFLRQLWSTLQQDDFLLIGFDLKKDIDVLLNAYNDESGVTATFNLNLLSRINRELGGHFDIGKFRHYSTYDVFTGAMESYLVSLARQTVAIDALHSEFTFEPWEPVHTEYSYKYLDSDIAALAHATGFTIADSFYDARRWFVGSLWQVTK